jgi:hypothetical protein
MKTLLLSVFTFFFVHFYSGYKNKAEMPVTIDFTKRNDNGSLKLSAFAYDIRFIKLETNKNSYISNFTGYVGEKYIISVNYDQVIQFSVNGKFLRTIARQGRGPEEFGQIDAWEVDKNEHFLIYHIVGKDYITKYNLDSYMFENNIPFINKGYLNKIILINDSLISILPDQFSNYGYLFFNQSIDGLIIEGRKKKFTPMPRQWVGEFPIFLKATDGSIFYQPSGCDTIFNIVGSEVKPLISLIIEKPHKNEEITSGFNYSFLYLDNKRIYFQKSGYENRKTSSSLSTKTISNEYLFFDRKTNGIFKIDSFFYDYLGIELKIPYMSFLNGNQFVINYQALDFKVMLGDALKKGEVSESKRDKLKQLYNEISENDNPILVIGKCK